MNTYLFVWNPKNWEWKDLDSMIETLNKTGITSTQWSCASHKSIHLGDRAFLIRLGTQPKGILGSGYVSSMPFQASHWSDPNKISNKVMIEFDTLINPEKDPILPLEKLEEDLPSNQVWSSRTSGIIVREEVTSILEELWFEFLKLKNKKNFSNKIINEDQNLSFFEGNPQESIQTRYERNPHARKICVKHFGYSCFICKFNFESTYGEIGKDFIHVHHLKPISEIGLEYEIDPIKDLRPVCPNCHAMIHRDGKTLTMEEMMKLLH
jgi:5-methylcytosine-specific restriction protein A